MPKLVPCKFRKLRKILIFLGFRERDAQGSHVFFEHNDGRTTVAPRWNKEYSKGLLRKILSDIDINVDEYERLRLKF